MTAREHRTSPRRSFVVLVGLLAAVVAVAPAHAVEWGFAGGFQSMNVPQADSATRGIHATVSYDHRFQGGSTIRGFAHFLLDDDEDELDPDHVPLWFRSGHRYEAELHRSTATRAFLWGVDLDGKRNTVSSVEWQVKAFPTIGLAFTGERLRGAIRAGAGYFALEIDDDVPLSRGYTREDLREQTAAYALLASGGVRLGRLVDLDAQAGYWGDREGGLESQFAVDLRIDSGAWIERTRFVIATEFTRYDLERYQPSGVSSDPDAPLPVLPWDHDVLIRVAFGTAW